MDASDIIRKLKEKTVFYNIQAQFSTAQASKGCNPKACGPNNCSYNFSDYQGRLDYFNGRFDLGASCSSCSTFCFQ